MRFCLALFLGAGQTEACAFAGQGSFPQDDVHQKVLDGGVSLIPDRLATGGNAFTSQSMLKPAVPTGGSRSLADELIDFADTQSEDMCYWSFQPLAPPKGEGRSLLHPLRHHWDMENGQWDDDIEWQSMLANIASARLKRIQELSNGTLVSTMCAAGRDLAQRRCNNGRAATDTWMDQCDSAIYNQEIRWGMAITIWKIGPELKEWVRYWRSNNSFGHTPNIQWTYRGGSPSSEPYVWNGGAPLPPPSEIDHDHVPHGPLDWPASRGANWGAGDGASMLAKVLPCSQVPIKFQYPEEQYYCDHMSDGASQTTADEAYEFWKGVESAWPPTKECADNVTRLNEVLASIGISSLFDDCATAMKSLKSMIGNFDCDAIVPGRYMFRDVCCSECGAKRIPDLPASPPPTPAPVGDVYVCQVCQHVYDAAEDGDGLAFEDLPEDWACPICGMPKLAYQKKSLEREALV